MKSKKTSLDGKLKEISKEDKSISINELKTKASEVKGNPKVIQLLEDIITFIELEHGGDIDG